MADETKTNHSAPMPRASNAHTVPEMRSLKVYSNNRHVGWMAELNDIWQFEYSPEWVKWEYSWDISPAIARADGQTVDGSTLRPVQWFFDNLLPEEFMRTAIAARAKIQEADAFALLEYMGTESAGSLVLLSSDKEMPQERGYTPLEDATLDQRITDMPKVPLGSTSPKRMSLAGAQQKLLVNWDGKQLSEPLGITPSTHILKPEHLDPTYPHSVINEYAMMTLASKLGLDAPQVWRHYCPQPVYIVERFDRGVHAIDAGKHIAGSKGQQVTDRLHAIDVCQLLNKSRTYKYHAASIDSLRMVVEATRTRIHTRLGLFRWLLFNVLIGNNDNHLKNISLMVSHEGIQLAKTYDLLSTAVYHTQAFTGDASVWPAIDLAIPLPHQPQYANVTRDGLVEAGRQLGLTPTLANREIDDMASRIAPALDAIIRNVEGENANMSENTHVYHGGELRLLRAIRYVIVDQMLARL